MIELSTQGTGRQSAIYAERGIFRQAAQICMEKFRRMVSSGTTNSTPLAPVMPTTRPVARPIKISISKGIMKFYNPKMK